MDDIPLSLALGKAVGVAEILDRHRGNHGLQAGLSNGQLAAVWVACILRLLEAIYAAEVTPPTSAALASTRPTSPHSLQSSTPSSACSDSRMPSTTTSPPPLDLTFGFQRKKSLILGRLRPCFGRTKPLSVGVWCPRF